MSRITTEHRTILTAIHKGMRYAPDDARIAELREAGLVVLDWQRVELTPEGAKAIGVRLEENAA